MNTAVFRGIAPENWRIKTIIPIYKREGSPQCYNYRGITMLRYAAKIKVRITRNKRTNWKFIGKWAKDQEERYKMQVL